MNITLKVPESKRALIDFLFIEAIKEGESIEISPREGGWNVTCSNDAWVKWLGKVNP